MVQEDYLSKSKEKKESRILEIKRTRARHTKAHNREYIRTIKIDIKVHTHARNLRPPAHVHPPIQQVLGEEISE